MDYPSTTYGQGYISERMPTQRTGQAAGSGQVFGSPIPDRRPARPSGRSQDEAGMLCQCQRGRARSKDRTPRHSRSTEQAAPLAFGSHAQVPRKKGQRAAVGLLIDSQPAQGLGSTALKGARASSQHRDEAGAGLRIAQWREGDRPVVAGLVLGSPATGQPKGWQQVFGSLTPDGRLA